MGIPALIFAFAFLATLPHFDSGPRVFLNDVGFKPVIVEAEVLAVEPRADSRSTRLALRAETYLQGAGPDTVRIELRWINALGICTRTSNGHVLSVPRVGDRGIFWIGRQANDRGPTLAGLSSDGQIWKTENDSLPSVGWSLEEGKRAIREAVGGASLAAQLRIASHVVKGRLISWQSCNETVRPADPTCIQVRAEEVLRGSRLADTLITVLVPANNIKAWRNGLYLLNGPDSLGRFHPVHPKWSFVPTEDGKFVAGYKLVSDIPIDHVVPVLVDGDELLDMK